MQVAFAEGIGHCLRYFGFGQHQLSALLCDVGFHFLFFGDRIGATFFGCRLSNSSVRFGLVGLKACTDVFANIDIRNVDRDNFKRSMSIQATLQNRS